MKPETFAHFVSSVLYEKRCVRGPHAIHCCERLSQMLQLWSSMNSSPLRRQS